MRAAVACERINSIALAILTFFAGSCSREPLEQVIIDCASPDHALRERRLAQVRAEGMSVLPVIIKVMERAIDGHGRSSEALLECMGASAAVKELGGGAGARLVGYFLAEDSPERREAISRLLVSLGNMKGADIEPLMRHFEQGAGKRDKDRILRILAASGRQASPYCPEVLAVARSDRDLRRRAISTLGCVGCRGVDAIGFICETLEGGDRWDRIAALDALGVLKASEGIAVRLVKRSMASEPSREQVRAYLAAWRMNIIEAQECGAALNGLFAFGWLASREMGVLEGLLEMQGAQEVDLEPALVLELGRQNPETFGDCLEFVREVGLSGSPGIQSTVRRASEGHSEEIRSAALRFLESSRHQLAR